MSEYYRKLHGLSCDHWPRHVLVENFVPDLWKIVVGYCTYDSVSLRDFLETEKGKEYERLPDLLKGANYAVTEINSEYGTRKHILSPYSFPAKYYTIYQLELKSVFDVWKVKYNEKIFYCALTTYSPDMFGLLVIRENSQGWDTVCLYVARSIELLFLYHGIWRIVRGSKISIVDSDDHGFFSRPCKRLTLHLWQYKDELDKVYYWWSAGDKFDYIVRLTDGTWMVKLSNGRFNCLAAAIIGNELCHEKFIAYQPKYRVTNGLI